MFSQSNFIHFPQFGWRLSLLWNPFCPCRLPWPFQGLMESKKIGGEPDIWLPSPPPKVYVEFTLYQTPVGTSHVLTKLNFPHHLIKHFIICISPAGKQAYGGLTAPDRRAVEYGAEVWTWPATTYYCLSLKYCIVVPVPFVLLIKD